MKPLIDGLHIVTATVDPLKARDCFESWLGLSRYHLPVTVVWSTLGQPSGKLLTGKVNAERDMMQEVFGPGAVCHVSEGGGVVPAFAYGVEAAYAAGATTVLCLHDDVLIEERDWDVQVLGWQQQLDIDFGGFGGATQLGAENIYKVPYDPMQLARGNFRSNMRHAEAHGARTTSAEYAVCFDGFSQLGRGKWFRDAWRWLAKSGIQHHFYDGILGCFAARAKVRGYLLPVKCHHFGGRTAVGSALYQEWARTQDQAGDQGFWDAAHRIGYDQFKDVLPLRLR